MRESGTPGNEGATLFWGSASGAATRTWPLPLDYGLESQPVHVLAGIYILRHAIALVLQSVYTKGLGPRGAQHWLAEDGS